MIPERIWWKRWLLIGLAGCLADVMALGVGMGMAVFVPGVGLVVGLWAAWLAVRHVPDPGEARRLALWGGLVTGLIVMHFALLGDLGILLLIGPVEVARPITHNGLYEMFPFMRGLYPAFLDSTGAFWIVQCLGFMAATLVAAWLGALVGRRFWAARRRVRERRQEYGSV